MSLGLYVHIPFCQTKCYYCDFVSRAGYLEKARPYSDALIKEIVKQSKKLKGEKISSIYFGGGTPSVMPLDCLTDIMTAIRENLCIEENAEITTEMNPSSSSLNFIKLMQEIGFNRFSVGLQSADDAILKGVGRQHGVKDFVNTVTTLRKCGISNISADVMLGLPKQTNQSLISTIELLLQHKIPHISVYGLKVENGTRLKQMIDKGLAKVPSDDDAAEMYDLVYAKLEANKIYRYEVSNFSAVGYECKHNLNYWNWGRYLGVGAAAHSFLNDTRLANVNDIDNYIHKLAHDKLPVSKRHKLKLEEAEFEYIMLALRLERGMDIAGFNRIFCTDFIKRYHFVIKKLERLGLVVYDSNFINVVSGKMYMLNSILVEFMEY